MRLELTAPLGVLGMLRSPLPDGSQLEFERTAAVPGLPQSTLHVSGPGIDTIIASVRESPAIDSVSQVTETEDGNVYELEWTETVPEFIERVRASDGAIRSAFAVEDRWTFGLRFPDQTAASRFYVSYDDSAHPITITKASADRPARARDDALTTEQHDALTRAVEAGYFEVPRRTTMVELADDLGISDSAVSQRIRRGLATILREPTEHPQSRPSLRND